MRNINFEYREIWEILTPNARLYEKYYLFVVLSLVVKLEMGKSWMSIHRVYIIMIGYINGGINMRSLLKDYLYFAELKTDYQYYFWMFVHHISFVERQYSNRSRKALMCIYRVYIWLDISRVFVERLFIYCWIKKGYLFCSIVHWSNFQFVYMYYPASS